MPPSTEVRLFTRTDVERLLDMSSCIAAVEQAFRLQDANAWSSRSLGVPLPPNSGFHVKTALLELERLWFVAKINANFSDNPAQFGLPTIQGVLVLFDATCGVPVAIIDSSSITKLRTAATSAVAARHLARGDVKSLTVIGCGAQARAHVVALNAVRPLERIEVFDMDNRRASRFAEECRLELRLPVSAGTNVQDALRTSSMIVTCTSARKAFLDLPDIAPGTFIAAVGADHPHKQELTPALLRAAVVIVDDVEQCATSGDLHHALADGTMQREDVRATLADVVAGRTRGRQTDDEIIVFDSTGVALEDVAAAVVVYQRGEKENTGLRVPLGS